MPLSPLAKKLRLHTTSRALLLNPPAGFLESLGEVPESLRVDLTIAGKYDYTHLFVWDSAELQQSIDQALVVLEYDAIFWVSYPKGSSGVKTDINRDSLWQQLKEKGLRPVTQVSVDQVWSALRFRPAEVVGK